MVAARIFPCPVHIIVGGRKFEAGFGSHTKLFPNLPVPHSGEQSPNGSARHQAGRLAIQRRGQGSTVVWQPHDGLVTFGSTQTEQGGNKQRSARTRPTPATRFLPLRWNQSVANRSSALIRADNVFARPVSAARLRARTGRGRLDVRSFPRRMDNGFPP
jgi:hypothetical protein